ncbi:MAG: V-type ATP synthase subunit A, partial [Planctomycetota bacterium]
MSETQQGRIVKVAGPVVVAEGMTGARMYDVVRVGDINLIGEIVEIHGDQVSIQVYEETVGMGPGEPVV